MSCHLADCFFFFFLFCLLETTRTGRQKEQSLLELSRRLWRTPPSRWKHKHGTVQREPPTRLRSSWLCSSRIHRGCLRRGVQYVDAAFHPSTTLSLTPGRPDGGGQEEGGGGGVLLFLISEPLSLGEVGPTTARLPPRPPWTC